MAGDVFEEDPAQCRPEFPGDAGNVWPKVPLILGPAALSGRAERLAGVSGKQGVEGPGEGSSIEGGDIVPDRGVGQVSGPLGGNEGLARVILPLDEAARVELRLGEHEAHIKSAAACAEGEAVSGT